jgi:hypothetical protein
MTDAEVVACRYAHGAATARVEINPSSRYTTDGIPYFFRTAADRPATAARFAAHRFFVASIIALRPSGLRRLFRGVFSRLEPSADRFAGEGF